MAQVAFIQECDFEGATLVYRPDCNAEGGCHALQEGRYISVAPEHNHAINVITTWSHNVSSFYTFFCVQFTPVRGVNLIPNTVWSCRRILSRLCADLRENTTKQWGSRDALIQSTGSISDSARYHGDANIALGPILKMYIPGQIHFFNALNSDGYSTGNARQVVIMQYLMRPLFVRCRKVSDPWDRMLKRLNHLNLRNIIGGMGCQRKGPCFTSAIWHCAVPFK